MTQQQLDRAHVGARFQQMHGKGMPQGMRRNRFGDTATPTRLLARLLYGAPADMVVELIAREKPPPGSVHSPPVAQDLQQLWGKHDIAVYAPLCVGKIYVAMVSQLPAIKASSLYRLHISLAFPVADIPLF